MKVTLQRVSKATVTVKETNKIVGKIDKGLFILLGIKRGDGQKQVDELVEKISKLRIMADEKEKMNLSIMDTKIADETEILLVSQFTLYANTKDGNRPSFIEAEEPKKAKELYEYFVKRLREKGIKVETGSFGDYMEISCILDGPVTIDLEN